MSQGTDDREPDDSQSLLGSQTLSSMDNLSQATANLNIEGDTANPIIQAGKRIYQQLDSMQLEVCGVCKENAFDMEVGPRSGRCKSCTDYKHNHRNQPELFSHDNRMDPGVQPPCLKVLNRVERAAIARIAPIQNIIKLKGGNLAQRGHSISFFQDVSGFAKKLPRGQEDLPFIIIRSPNQEVPLKANRIKILAALEWLVAYHPEYTDVVIDQEVLATYPSDDTTSLTGLRHIDTDETLTRENMASMVHATVAPGDGGNTVEDTMTDVDEIDIPPSLAPGDVPQETVNDSIRQAVLKTNSGDGSKEIPWPEREDRPASEFLLGFFSM